MSATTPAKELAVMLPGTCERAATTPRELVRHALAEWKANWYRPASVFLAQFIPVEAYSFCSDQVLAAIANSGSGDEETLLAETLLRKSGALTAAVACMLCDHYGLSGGDLLSQDVSLPALHWKVLDNAVCENAVLQASKHCLSKQLTQEDALVLCAVSNLVPPRIDPQTLDLANSNVREALEQLAHWVKQARGRQVFGVGSIIPAKVPSYTLLNLRVTAEGATLAGLEQLEYATYHQWATVMGLVVSDSVSTSGATFLQYCTAVFSA